MKVWTLLIMLFNGSGDMVVGPDELGQYSTKAQCESALLKSANVLRETPFYGAIRDEGGDIGLACVQGGYEL